MGQTFRLRRWRQIKDLFVELVNTFNWFLTKRLLLMGSLPRGYSQWVHYLGVTLNGFIT